MRSQTQQDGQVGTLMPTPPKVYIRDYRGIRGTIPPHDARIGHLEDPSSEVSLSLVSLIVMSIAGTSTFAPDSSILGICESRNAKISLNLRKRWHAAPQWRFDVEL